MDNNNIKTYEPEEESKSFRQKTRGFFRNISSVRQILLWYLIISLTGAILLWMPFSHTGQFNNEYGDFGLSFIDALFVSSSSFSDTGLSPVGIYDTFNLFGQIITLILLQVGGVGWFTIKIFILTFVLRKTTNYNTIADGTAELGTASKNETLGLIFCAVITSATASIFGGLIFGLIFYFTDVVGAEHFASSLWIGIYHASASINNSGLDIFVGNDSMATLYGDFAGIKVGWEVAIESMTIFLFILGGIGFGIIYDIFKYFKSKSSGERFNFSVITKLSVVIYLSVALLGLGAAYLSEGMAVIGDSQHAFLSKDWIGTTELGSIHINWPKLELFINNYDGGLSQILQDINDIVSSGGDFPFTIDSLEKDGFLWINTTFINTNTSFRWWVLTFNTFSTRNAGFATMNLALLQNSTKFIYTIMMFIGSGPGSTAGGLRTTTFGVIIVSLWAIARNKPQIHAFGKAISYEVSKKAFIILSISLLLVAGDVMVISITEKAAGHTTNNFIDNMFVVFSAYGTTGLSVTDLGTYHWFSKITLILLMFIGQMGISNTLNQLRTKQIKHQKQFIEEYVNLG